MDCRHLYDHLHLIGCTYYNSYSLIVDGVHYDTTDDYGFSTNGLKHPMYLGVNTSTGVFAIPDNYTSLVAPIELSGDYAEFVRNGVKDVKCIPYYYKHLNLANGAKCIVASSIEFTGYDVVCKNALSSDITEYAVPTDIVLKSYTISIISILKSMFDGQTEMVYSEVTDNDY